MREVKGMKSYIDERLQYLTDTIATYLDKYNLRSEIEEERQLKKCKTCEWANDTGTSVYCIWKKCRR